MFVSKRPTDNKIMITTADGSLDDMLSISWTNDDSLHGYQ